MDNVKEVPKTVFALPPERRRRSAPVFDTIETAAAKLDMAATALRARCRRASVREGREIVAYLGAGIVAYKMGRSWRVRFPPTP